MASPSDDACTASVFDDTSLNPEDARRRRPGWALPSGALVALLIAGCSAASSPGNTGDDGGSGGQVGAGGSVGTGGHTAGTGGNTTASGGSVGTGGANSSTGGTTSSGGTVGSGGVTASGGSSGSGGASGGGTGSGGKTNGSGGSSGSGGMSAGGSSAGGSKGGAGGATGGAGGTAAGGSSGSAGSSGGQGPCDIYKTAGTPCAAAHSMVRALFAAYSGPLYQVRKSDNSTKDVPVGAGGFVDVSVQNSFCSGSKCTISILYDQTSNHNDLKKSPVAHWLTNGGTEADASLGQTTVSGHTVHGIYVTGYSGNVAYRNNATTGVPKGDQAESMYMVVDGKRYSDQCCFDYGNAETSGNDDGNGTMEAVYFGNDITWGGKGEGNGPWVAGDLENGVFKSDKGGWQSQSLSVPNAKSIVAPFAVAMLKGPSGNHFTLKGGNAQSGTLTTMWDGNRPSPGYSPKKLMGAIILGTGGDGSNGGTGTFYEGVMTSGNPSDAVDAMIQANIVAAGFGK